MRPAVSEMRVGTRLAMATVGLLLALAAPASAEPPAERTLVNAVADADQDRILVRWMWVEGATRRYTHFDVLRRAAGQSGFTQLNAAPIGPLQTAAQIESVFTAPGRADALAAIQQTFGADYANDLLTIQAAGAPDTFRMRLALLPDLNYGAAIALGLGWMDEPVTSGVSHVYEVWGLDPQGFRAERLGRATARAGTPPQISAAVGPQCVDLGDERSHMAAFLRWGEAPAAATERTAGYDIYRALKPGNGPCPPIAPGLPGVSRANLVPTPHDAPGNPAAGGVLFQTHCLGCHPGGREPAQADNVAGTTIAQFRRLQIPALASPASHDLQTLQGLAPDQIRSIFDWVGEFHHRDDAIATSGGPLSAGETYCYQPLPRNLLGEHGPAAFQPAECTIEDRRPPSVPSGLRAQRVTQGGGTHEVCRITWERNAGPGDDTVDYLLMRGAEAPRLGEPPAPAGFPVVIAQPVPGPGVSHTDLTLSPADAGESFFYAVRARDGAGNASAPTGWIPCVPRDIVPPPAATLAAECCSRVAGSGCEDKGDDRRWTDAGGDRILIADPARCPVHLTCGAAGDTFRCRLYRAFDGGDPLPGEDVPPAAPFPVDFAPMIDHKLVIQAKALDKSFNISPMGSPVAFVYKGAKPLPPPRIVSVALSDPEGYVRIRFRSLAPEALLGFALYRQVAPPDGDPLPEQLTVRHPAANLSAAPVDAVSPADWAVKAGAVNLSQVPGFLLPSDPVAQGDDWLYYNTAEGLYVLKVNVVDTADLILRLVAIGWSGEEGLSDPYVWDGWQPGDGILDWPAFRSANYRFIGSEADLTATPAAGQMMLSWTAHPDGCLADAALGARPFVVFRMRGSATRWSQISPPFVCDGQNSSLTFLDNDVEPGLAYTYIVVRLDGSGEFTFQNGPTTAVAP